MLPSLAGKGLRQGCGYRLLTQPDLPVDLRVTSPRRQDRAGHGLLQGLVSQAFPGEWKTQQGRWFPRSNPFTGRGHLANTPHPSPFKAGGPCAPPFQGGTSPAEAAFPFVFPDEGLRGRLPRMPLGQGFSQDGGRVSAVAVPGCRAGLWRSNSGCLCCGGQSEMSLRLQKERRPAARGWCPARPRDSRPGTRARTR